MVETIERTRTPGWRGGRRTALELTSEREAERLARTLGSQVTAARRGKGWTQAQLAARVGLSQSRISSIEDGLGAGAPLGVWIALGIALNVPLAVAFSRSLVTESADAGHLPGQELALGLARRNGRPGSVELPTRPFNPSRMIDVAVRDDLRRVLVLQEISNRIDDIGQTIRDHRRKVAEADAVAAVIGGDGGPYRVAFCWIVRATAANRALLARFPEVIGRMFPGSSRAWVKALAEGGPIPLEPGLVWMDVACTCLFEYRRVAMPEAHRPHR